MKPNKLSVAEKQVEKFSGIEVPKTIREDEKHLVHVLIIESRPNRTTMGWNHKATRQMFSVEAFGIAEKGKKYAQIGAEQMIIFHDPRVKTKDEDSNEGPGNDEGSNDEGTQELPNVEEAIDMIDACESTEQLNSWLEVEKAGKNRKTVLSAINHRLNEIGE